MLAEITGRIISGIVPGGFLLNGRLGDWYERNPFHKFAEGNSQI